MRLVLIHGRAQGKRSSAEIHAEWMPALERGCESAGVRLPSEIDVRVPYYGDILDGAVGRLGDADRPVPRGPSAESLDDFQTAVTLSLAHGAGITDEEITVEMGRGVVERGAQNWLWVQAAGRLISRRCPWFGEFIMRELTEDVYAYMTRPDVCRAVNEIVVTEIDMGPAVVVGHSLGSIVGYWTLTAFPHPLTVPVLVTLGSPLGIGAVKALLPRPLGMPPPVQHWLNAADEHDPIALVSRLDRDHFPAKIENLSDIHNPPSNPHAIVGYLSDAIVAERIARAVS